MKPIEFEINVMRRLILGLFVALCMHANASEILKMDAAVRLAETYVAENGYTDLPESQAKPMLDNESVEWNASRMERLAQRHNTLLPGAIGAKRGRKEGQAGWSVAFDYSNRRANRDSCRVVTMAPNGSEIRIEHVDAVRKYFVGFGEN